MPEIYFYLTALSKWYAYAVVCGSSVKAGNPEGGLQDAVVFTMALTHSGQITLMNREGLIKM